MIFFQLITRHDNDESLEQLIMMAMMLIKIIPLECAKKNEDEKSGLVKLSLR